MTHFHPDSADPRRRCEWLLRGKPEAADFNMSFRSAPIPVIEMPVG